MDLIVRQLTTLPLESSEVEIVERKGLGHPDTICDALAEELSIALCHFYQERFGLLLHHNIGDKLRLKASCQVGNGDKSRRGLARFGRIDLTIPKSRFLGEVR